MTTAHSQLFDQKNAWFALVIFINPTAILCKWSTHKQMCHFSIATFRSTALDSRNKKITGLRILYTFFFFFTSGYSRTNPLFVFKQSQQLLASRPWNKQEDEEAGYCCWMLVITLSRVYGPLIYPERGGSILIYCY